MKKFLSLVLALVMTMSLVTISAGAKDFTDSADISYEEAVEVMSEIGIVDGDTAGNFNPQNGLTRGAAAKIICNMILGPTTAAELNADTDPFSDVDKDSTFAGYIAYCAKEGIVGGYADGTFKPAAPLTGYAFMKMLLGALGYDAATEGYAEPNWSINVAKQAIGIGLNAGLVDEFNGSDYVTREEAMLYAFNTLQATMVEYNEKTTVTVGGAEVVLAGTAQDLAWGTGLKADGKIEDDGFVQFAEKYFTKLEKTPDTDAFMRPAYTWIYNKEEIGTYVDTSKLVAEYTVKVTGREIYDLLKAATIRDCDLEVYVDGTEATGAEVITKAELVRANTEGVGVTGTGVETEVYLDADKDLITIVSVNTWLAQATADYKESKEYAPLKVFNGVNTTKTYNVDVVDVAAVADVEDEGYYLVNISKKFNTVNGEIVEIMDCEVLTDSTVTKFSAENEGDGKGAVTSLTTGGEKYSAAKKAFYDADILDTYNDGLLTDATYNVYKDQYGNFIGVDLFEGTKNYVFITGYNLNTSNLAVKTAEAGAIFMDGTMSVIDVNVTDTDKNIDKAKADKTQAAGIGYFGKWSDDAKNGGVWNENCWYSYVVDEDGTYTLKPAARMTMTYCTADTVIDTANVYVDDTSGKGTRVYGEDNTVFLTADTDKVNPSSLKNAICEVTGVYTGVQSVDLEIDVSEYPSDVNHIFTVYDSDNYIIAAVILADAKGSTANYAYILSGAKSEEKIDDTYYWEFDAIQGGEIVTLTAKSKYPSTIQALTKGTVQELRVDGDYVVSIKDTAKLYTDNTKKIVDEDVYSISNAKVINLQGRTLYVTADQKDVGLALLSDAKAVTIQDENAKTDVKTEFDSVAEAVAHLADPDKDATNGLQYSGKIIALLNTKGQAEWVVFDSNTPLTTGTTSNNTVSSKVTATVSIWDRTVTLKGTQVGEDVFTPVVIKALADAGYEATGWDKTTKPWTMNAVNMNSMNPSPVPFAVDWAK